MAGAGEHLERGGVEYVKAVVKKRKVVLNGHTYLQDPLKSYQIAVHILAVVRTALLSPEADSSSMTASESGNMILIESVYVEKSVR